MAARRGLATGAKYKGFSFRYGRVQIVFYGLTKKPLRSVRIPHRPLDYVGQFPHLAYVNIVQCFPA